jgi:hypothetical protein
LTGFQISENHAVVDHEFTFNIAEQNGLDGFVVFTSTSTFARNRSNYNGSFGILDDGAGGNTYTGNRCTGNELGDSSPPGLCF